MFKNFKQFKGRLGASTIKLFTAAKSFIVQAPGVNLIKLFDVNELTLF
jgi:hypothetical protein